MADKRKKEYDDYVVGEAVKKGEGRQFMDDVDRGPPYTSRGFATGANEGKVERATPRYELKKFGAEAPPSDMKKFGAEAPPSALRKEADSYKRGGRVKFGSNTNCGPMCRDTKTIR